MKLHSVFILMFMFALFGRAHEPGLSTLKLHYRDQQLLATLILSPRDLESVVMLDLNSDGIISGDEVGANKEILDQLARGLLTGALDGDPLSVLQTQCVLDQNNNFEVQTTFAPHSGTSLNVTSKWVIVLPPGHRQFVTFQEATGPAVTEDLLDAANYVFTATLSPPEEPALVATPTRLSFWAFFILGVEHILTGYDHLLFLLALLLVCDSFKSIAKIITCFTLAHSITLALATLNIVHLPASLVEPAIAASILYVGLENILRRGQPKGRSLLTFAFGLVHGFGFATVLRDMGISEAGSVAMPLVSFNLGVEAGQIAVAFIVLPIIWQLRKRKDFERRWIPVGSMIVAAAGVYWFVVRVWF